MLYADQFIKKVSEWKITADRLIEYTHNDDASQQLAKTAECIIKCGDILDAYADLIRFAEEKYEENEKSLIKALEE